MGRFCVCLHVYVCCVCVCVCVCVCGVGGVLVLIVLMSHVHVCPVLCICMFVWQLCRTLSCFVYLAANSHCVGEWMKVKNTLHCSSCAQASSQPSPTLSLSKLTSLPLVPDCLHSLAWVNLLFLMAEFCFLKTPKIRNPYFEISTPKTNHSFSNTTFAERDPVLLFCFFRQEAACIFAPQVPGEPLSLL